MAATPTGGTARTGRPFPAECNTTFAKAHPGSVRPIVVTELRSSAYAGSSAAPVREPSRAETPAHQAYGVLLRTRARGGIFDVVVYQDAMLLSHANTTDPAMVGALIGLVIAPVVGAIVGVLIGERVARNSASKRLQDLFYAPPELLFDQDRKNRFIRASDVRRARVWEYGARQRILELQLRDGATWRLKFDARFESNSFAVETLRVALGPALEVEHRRFRPASVAIGAVLAVLVTMIAVMIVMTASGVGA